jgi:hypothetical protein
LGGGGRTGGVSRCAPALDAHERLRQLRQRLVEAGLRAFMHCEHEGPEPTAQVLVEKASPQVGEARQRRCVRHRACLVLTEEQQVEELQFRRDVIGQFVEIVGDGKAAFFIEALQRHRAVLHQWRLFASEPHRRIGLRQRLRRAEEEPRVVDEQLLHRRRGKCGAELRRLGGRHRSKLPLGASNRRAVLRRTRTSARSSKRR